MFEPTFRYTNKTITNLTSTAESRAIILNAPLVPQWEVSLRKDARLMSAHSSTAIEGNPLSLKEVTELAEGRDIMVRRKDKQEVLNYLDALSRTPKFAQRNPFAVSDLLELHKTVTKDTLDNVQDEGAFRNRQVFVVNRATGDIVFTPPVAGDVEGLVHEFLEWFSFEKTREIDPVVHAGITHYEIVRIHPFVDGNGRTARMMATIALYRRGFDMKRFFALDDYYDHDRKAYYAALQTVDPDTQDLTAWLEYFTEGVAVSTKAVRDRVIGLSKDIKVLKERGQIALTDRQMSIVEMMVQKGRVGVGEVARAFQISRQSALKEMDKLVDLAVVLPRGRGRTAHYVLS